MYQKLIGQGTLRLDPNNVKKVLNESLGSGLSKIVDISTGYSGGQTLREVGEYLRTLPSAERKDIKISAKFGMSDKKYNNSIEIQPGAYYSLERDLLNDQFQQVTENIGSVDFFLIQNPEFMLENNSVDQQKILTKKLQSVFLDLEVLRRDNPASFGYYGISSNSFASLEYKELPKISKQAFTLSGSNRKDPGFKVVQFPLNLLEPVDKKFQQWYNDNDLFSISYRPLSAFLEQVGNTGAQLEPFKLVETDPPKQYTEVKEKLLFWLSPDFGEEDKEAQTVLAACGWLKVLIHDIEKELQAFDSVEHFRSDLGEKILPLINEKLEGLDESTFDLLRNFFLQFEELIKYNVGLRAKKKLEQTIGNSPEKLQSIALKYVFEQEVDAVIIGMNQIWQVDSLKDLQKTA
eukprot:maker-scaffold_58-snap-gene-0.18-mRNA-1 protein AED:0.24 eAED:0.24 QI:69/1/1/1/0/0/2/27/404